MSTLPKSLNIVIMAAGKGTRMRSKTPKVLQMLGGKQLVQHVIDTAHELGAQQIVVVTGHEAPLVEDALKAANSDLTFVRQMPQLGTGHCVLQAVPQLMTSDGPEDSITLILSGDVPLTKAETLQRVIVQCAGQHLALLTIEFANPEGYGRIVRKQVNAGGSEQVASIVEHKDASHDQRAIRECYSGILAAPTSKLKEWLAKLDNNNAAGEFYLTDIVKHAVSEGTQVLATCITDSAQVDGVNSPVQLAALERALQKRIALELMESGTRLADPSRIDVRGQLTCAMDVEIDVNCVFTGSVELGNNVRVGSNCVIADAVIGDGTVIHPFTHIEGQTGKPVKVGAGALIGPFARLRPGANLGDDVHIGNFVEIKNSTLSKGAKANHLAYIGDASVGERVNYGAGSITANYDGANKHKTVIESDVHVGSNCVIVAPIKIGAGGTIGAGSTVTKDTPAGALTVARGKQVYLANWERPKKK